MYRAKHTFWYKGVEYIQGSLHKEIPEAIINDFDVVSDTKEKQVKKAVNKKVKTATTK